MQILTNENYKEIISKGKVIVDFWATWCGPCKMFKAAYEDLAAKEEYKDYVFCEADVDVCNVFAEELGISNVPTFVVFEDGKEVIRGNYNTLFEHLKGK